MEKSISVPRRSLDLAANNTTLGTEFRAGATTFMTMAYILVVQPLIMSACGMPRDAVFTSTALSTALSTLMMGIYGKFPFALAPAMGTNAIFAYSIVNTGQADWQTALGMIVWSGLAFMLVSFPILRWTKILGLTNNPKIYNFCLRESVTNNIPAGIKLGLAAAIGIFLAQLGLGSSGMNVATVSAEGIALGDLGNPTVLIGVICTIVVIVLFWVKGPKFNVLGAILLGMLAITGITMAAGLTPLPEGIVSLPPSFSEISFQANILGALKPQYIPYIFVFFMGDFFSTTGTALACGAKAGFADENGNMAGIDRIFHVDSLWSVLGALVFGMTTITTYVESAAGVEEGGRTGWTAVFASGLFFVSLFLFPIFVAIPAVATGMALFVVGISMLLVLEDPNFKKLDRYELIPVIVLMLITAVSGDFSSALCAALIIYGVIGIVRRLVQPDAPKVTVMTIALLVMAVSKFAVTI